jgi:outer membrane protein TolC
MRCKPLWGLLALSVVLLGGCKQRCFMTEQDFQRTTTTSLQYLEEKPDLGAQPLTELVPAPPTLTNLDRKVRFISLAECIAIALEQGRVGQPSLLFPGQSLDNLVQFTGRGISGSDAIRVFALQPALQGAEIEGALSKFDAILSTSLNWVNTDQPISNPIAAIQAGGLPAISQQQANASAALIKPLASGGVTGITFNVPYLYTNLPNRLNPAYTPSLQFSFEQPLLQGFGVEINQIRAAHPGSVLNPGVFQTQTTTEGVLISRIRFDQSRADFERVLNQMLLNVETAYWNLYGSYWTLYSREQGLRFAYETYKKLKSEFEAGRSSIADFAQVRGQYEQFRAQRLQAIDTVLENERQLRNLMGMPIEDGYRLMPSDSPTLAPYQPDFTAGLKEALEKRPELHMIRQEIKAAQMQVLLAKNQLLPDLRFTASYDVNALGSRLDGGDQTQTFGPDGQPTGLKQVNAFRNLAQDNFNSWNLGLRMTMPLGFRFGHTQLRQAQLRLATAIETLKEQELKVQSYLANFYRRLSLNYETIIANRAQREAFGEQLQARFQEVSAGRKTVDILLEAQRFWADALNSEYQSIVQYNNALVGWEFAKGTIQHHNNIHIAEGPLPTCTAIRAVDHERQRTAALVLRERATPPAALPLPDKVLGSQDGKVPSLPAVLAAVPPLQDVPPLPTPTDAVRMPTLPKLVEAKLEPVVPNTPAPAPTPGPTPMPALPTPTLTPPAGSVSVQSNSSKPLEAFTPTVSQPSSSPPRKAGGKPPRRPGEFGSERLPLP